MILKHFEGQIVKVKPVVDVLVHDRGLNLVHVDLVGPLQEFPDYLPLLLARNPVGG